MALGMYQMPALILQVLLIFPMVIIGFLANCQCLVAAMLRILFVLSSVLLTYSILGTN